LLPGARCRFWFSAQTNPWLVIEHLDKTGTERFRGTLSEHHGAHATTGLLIVDNDERCVVVTETEPEPFLQDLSRWVRRLGRHYPGLFKLVGARVLAGSLKLSDTNGLQESDFNLAEAVAAPDAWAGMSRPGAEQVAETLAMLWPGDRFWYWVSERNSVPPVLVSADSDPLLIRLNDLVKSIGVRGAVSQGVGLVAQDGTLQLIGSDVTEKMLRMLAGWTRAHVEAHPMLGRLANTELVLSGERGRVLKIHRVPEQWQGVGAAVVAGSLKASAQALSSLKAGENAWFWLTRSGPGKAPFLFIEPMEDEIPFDGSLRRLRKRFPDSTDRVFGAVRRAMSGRLVFTTSIRTLDAFADVMEALATQEGFLELTGATLLRLEGGQVAEVIGAGAAPLSPIDEHIGEQAAFLDTLSARDGGLFWLAGIGTEQPVLVLAPDRDNLKRVAQGIRAVHPAPGEPVRGRLEKHPSGWLLFSAKKAAPGFLEAVASWFHRDERLAGLSHARFKAVDADGQLLDRQRDDSLWGGDR
jgi:hypothetical protein